MTANLWAAATRAELVSKRMRLAIIVSISWFVHKIYIYIRASPFLNVPVTKVAILTLEISHDQRTILRDSDICNSAFPAFFDSSVSLGDPEEFRILTMFLPLELSIFLSSLYHWRNHLSNPVYNFLFVWQFLAAKLVGTGSSGPFVASSFVIGFDANRSALTWRASSGLIETALLFNELIQRNSH